MRNRLIGVFSFILLISILRAQDSSIKSSERRDSTTIGDVSQPSMPRNDSLSLNPGFLPSPVSFDADPNDLKSGWPIRNYQRTHPYYRVLEKAVNLPALERSRPATDWIFYLFAGLCLLLGLLRLAFPRYLQDLFRVFLNTSIRQKQIREQLLGEPLPSLMFNLFFVLSAGTFLYFLTRHWDWTLTGGPWIPLAACIGLVLVVYVFKFLILRFLGWVFGIDEATENYTFVVFLVNKVLGLVLLPAAIFLALTENSGQSIILIVLAGLLILLLGYRLVRAFLAIHSSLKINQLHFLLYVIAFEVVPVLVLYKVLYGLFT